jgi:hypothetical protein
MDWFGFGKAEQVLPVAYSDGTLTFHSSEPYRVGKAVKVQLLLTCAERVETPSVNLTITYVEEIHEGTFLCVGALQMDARRTQELKVKLSYAGVQGACRRSSRRLETMVRVLSKELPGFQAVTRDVSLTGVQLVCDGPVAQGSYLNLSFDLDVVGFPELVMQAVCVRCAEEAATSRNAPKCRVGVAFTPQHPETHAAWAKFYDHLMAQQGASLMAKSLGTDTRGQDGVAPPAPVASSTIMMAPPPPPPPPPPAPAPSPSASSDQGVAATQTVPPHRVRPGLVGVPPPYPAGSAPVAYTPPGAPAAPEAPYPSAAPAGAYSPLTFDNLPPPPMPVAALDFEPAPAQPMGIDGVNFVFRALDDDNFLVGALRQVEIDFQHEGQWMARVVSVVISRVEPAPSGLCMCWGTLREDALTVQLLNRSLS